MRPFNLTELEIHYVQLMRDLPNSDREMLERLIERMAEHSPAVIEILPIVANVVHLR
jgi:glycerol-3-phosphate responsive antiterminator